MQEYKAYVNQEHVISGNDVLFKCDIPSFVADFVSVQSWADNEGVIHATHSQGNRHICAIVLGVRDLLDLRLLYPDQSDFVSWSVVVVFFAAVITIDYEVDVFKETVIRGNDALLKCQIPSFISDLVTVDSWVDSRGNDIRSNDAVIGNWELIPLPFLKIPLSLVLRIEVNIYAFSASMGQIASCNATHS